MWIKFLPPYNSYLSILSNYSILIQACYSRSLQKLWRVVTWMDRPTRNHRSHACNISVSRKGIKKRIDYGSGSHSMSGSRNKVPCISNYLQIIYSSSFSHKVRVGLSAFLSDMVFLSNPPKYIYYSRISIYISPCFGKGTFCTCRTKCFMRLCT